MYNINFDKTTRTNGLPSATVHRERLTNSNCHLQSKRLEQGHWEPWNDLLSEGTVVPPSGWLMHTFDDSICLLARVCASICLSRDFSIQKIH